MDLRDQLQRTLGDTYTLERELGGGGMSRVFVAKELALGRQVVIKVLPPETAAQLSIERFKREISLAAQLQQAHIVPLLSAGEADGLPYYTMPFVDGESLRARIGREGALPVGEAIGILKEVARALAYAHQHGVVHRDIKPDNVLLSGGSAMVTDFGVAKALSASTNPGGSGLTSLGVALGTPAYMAPEQATADPLVDHRADIYAWGAMAYELLTGQPPFAGRPPQAMLAAHVNEAPEQVTKRRSAVPPALATLVMRSLEKRAADRPQSAAEIVLALEAIVTPSGGAEPAAATRAAGVGARIWSRPPTRVALPVLVVLLGLMVAGLLVWRHSSSGATSGSRSIAVLPLRNLSGDKANDYFGEGLAEELTDALGKAGLRVIGRTSAAALAKNGLDAQAIARQLGVGSVLQGSVQREGQRIHITVQLVAEKDGAQLWSNKYDRRLNDWFAVQDEIARSVAGELRVTLGSGARATLARAETADPEAHTLYLQGLGLWNRRTAQSLHEAIGFFERALARDPRYARAEAGIAMAYTVLPVYEDVLPDSMYAKARAAAGRALVLDSTVADAYMALGEVDGLQGRNAEAAEAFRRAIVLDSTSGALHHWYAHYLMHTGHIDEAVREIQHAQSLDPASLVINSNVGQQLCQARRCAEAEVVVRRVLELDSTYGLGRWILFDILNSEGKTAESTRLAEEDISRPGVSPSVRQASLAIAYARAGRTREARAIVERVRGLLRGQANLHLAQALDALGEREQAVDVVRAAVAQHDPYVFYNSRYPGMDRLRADPRVAALLAGTEAMNDSRERRR